MFRSLLAIVLISLVGTCPIVCGTAHAGLCGHGSGQGRTHEKRSDLPAPANDDDCVCNGAIKDKAPDTGGLDWTDAGAQLQPAILIPYLTLADIHVSASPFAAQTCHPPAADALRSIVLRC